jgi:hypothetical protein
MCSYDVWSGEIVQQTGHIKTFLYRAHSDVQNSIRAIVPKEKKIRTAKEREERRTSYASLKVMSPMMVRRSVSSLVMSCRTPNRESGRRERERGGVYLE